jgi:hypothetical protein
MASDDIWSIDAIVRSDAAAAHDLSERIARAVAGWVEEDESRRDSTVLMIRVGDRSRKERRTWWSSFDDDRRARAAADDA